MSDSFTYQQTIELLDDLWSRPIIPAARAKLERARILLESGGNPHCSFGSAHVAGSSGKGSTTTMIGSILQHSGLRTGYFRSPHLESYTERIAVDGIEITQDEWVACFKQVWPTAREMIDGTLAGYNLGRPSFFEVLFAVASLYFRSKGVEWAAIETGMGGRLDTTNLLDSTVAVVTNISLEHTQVLGATVGAIAQEKAAIIKRGCAAVTAATDPTALEIIERRASEVGASLTVVPRDVWAEVESETVSGSSLMLRSHNHASLPVHLSLAGSFQATNAATAMAAAIRLRERGVAISDAAIIAGLEHARAPGRFEVVGVDPLVILDGAHNPDAAIAFRRALDRLAPRQRVVMVFAALIDKDVAAMAAELAPRADLVVLTTAPNTPRALGAASLAAYFTERKVLMIEDTGLALERALAETGSEDILVVCGSLYLVGFARAHLKVPVRT